MSNLHNELKSAGVFTKAVRRMFGGDDELAVERLSETLQTVVNPWDHPECSFLRQEKLFAHRLVQAATAAEFGFAAILNPAGSGELLTIERVTVKSGAAGSASLSIESSGEITAGTDAAAFVFLRDGRWGAALGTGRSIAHRGGNAALVGDNIQEVVTIVTANDQREAISPPYIIQPGFGLLVEHQTVNVLLDVNFVGRERKALSGELDV